MRWLRWSAVITIGIDLGGTKMSAGLVEKSGSVLEKVTVARPVDQAGMVEGPLELVAELMRSEVAGIGLGAAGLVNRPDGRLVWGPNVAGRDIPFGDLLNKRFGLPALIDNDANLAAWAESRAGGPRCTCGQRGCWETFASGRRLDQIARDVAAADPDGLTARLAGDGPPDGVHLTEAALQGDVPAGQSVAEMGTWLGVGLANLVVLLDPDVIVVGGGASRAGEVLLKPAREAMTAAVEGSRYRTPTPVVPAALAEDAGLVGAGLAAMELSRG